MKVWLSYRPHNIHQISPRIDDEIIYSWCFNPVEYFDSTSSAIIIILDEILESFSSLRSQQWYQNQVMILISFPTSPRTSRTEKKWRSYENSIDGHHKEKDKLDLIWWRCHLWGHMAPMHSHSPLGWHVWRHMTPMHGHGLLMFHVEDTCPPCMCMPLSLDMWWDTC